MEQGKLPLDHAVAPGTPHFPVTYEDLRRRFDLAMVIGEKEGRKDETRIALDFSPHPLILAYPGHAICDEAGNFHIPGDRAIAHDSAADPDRPFLQALRLPGRCSRLSFFCVTRLASYAASPTVLVTRPAAAQQLLAFCNWPIATPPLTDAVERAFIERFEVTWHGSFHAFIGSDHSPHDGLHAWLIPSTVSGAEPVLEFLNIKSHHDPYLYAHGGSTPL